MKAIIYGKPACTYCKQAVALAEAKGIEHEYIDITVAGIDGAALGVIMGGPVQTVPQILVDDVPVGGFVEFKKLVDGQ